MLSYVVIKVGELLKTLEEQQLDEDTLIIFTSECHNAFFTHAVTTRWSCLHAGDHGDMQGERGMWFKVPGTFEVLGIFELFLVMLGNLPRAGD